MSELRPDTLAMNYDEAIGYLGETDLQNKMLVLEDQSGGEVVTRALLGGGPEEYTIVAKEFDSGTDWEQTVDRIEAAEIIAGWSVVGKLHDNGRPVAQYSERDGKK